MFHLFCQILLSLNLDLRAAGMTQWLDRSPPTKLCGLDLVPDQCHVWSVVGSPLAPSVFLQVLCFFFPLNRNQLSKFQFDQNRRPT